MTPGMKERVGILIEMPSHICINFINDCLKIILRPEVNSMK